MSINSLYNTTMRFSGIASGIDTETIIRNLMQIEQLKVDRLNQDKTRTEWLRDDYRSIYKLLKDFKDTRFDVLNNSTYMLSSNAYRTYKVTNSNEEYVSVSPRSGISAGTTTIEYIESLATSASLTSDDGVCAPISGRINLDEGIELKDKSISITLDGVTKTINFTNNYDNSEAGLGFLESNLQGLLNNAFGAGRVTANIDSEGKLELQAENSKLTVSGGTDSALGVLGLESGQSNRINLDTSLASAGLKIPLEAGETIEFKINGVSFSFGSDTTLRKMISDINSSKAGVKLSYSDLTDKFTLTADSTGAGKTIVIENDIGNFWASSIGLNKLEANGTDAVLSINGTRIVRSTNNFTIDGLNYSLKETYEGTKTAGGTAIKVSSEYDASAAVDKIKGFVEQYNKLIDTIHKKLSEEHFRDFAPLTEMQKEEMTEKEIELWEEKAKSGLLKGDRILEGITGQMRRALIDAVEGAGLTLSDIGIKTGNYMEKGKLLLDEAKLTDALQNRGDEVEKLFAAQSEISYSSNLTSAQRAQRYKQSGLMHRISDILNDYIRTTRDENGNKGILLERAGIVGDVSEFKNTLSEKIKRIDSRISDAVRLLQSKEESYWRKFTAMEKAIQQMNSQSAWLSQQLGGNNL
jgi:flagellar hook-associated protein 2